MNLSFSQLGRHGRLGNQLFQIMATFGIAEKIGADAAFPAWSYENYFTPALPHGDMEKARVSEKWFHHHELEIADSADLYGYFQSEKYFGNTRLSLKPELVEHCKSFYPIFDRETICIQIRRGDYVDNPNYYQMPITFYIDSLLQNFPNWQNSNILIISDDIEYCRVHFECLPNVTFSTGHTDIEDMMLGSCCDHFIISSSTFGWWTAYFGKKAHSKIIHSGHLFAGRMKEMNTTVDYWPKHWMSNHKDSYRLPMRDVTFTLPVFHDHQDRKNNLDLGLCLLQRDLDTNFIIMEQGPKAYFEYTAKWATYMKFESKYFHRTKMLNDMAIASTTPIIVNWDVDVIVPPLQLYYAAMLIRQGAEMVFPYDGRFARMAKDPWFKNIQKSLDIGIVGNLKFKGREVGHNSVGGAVMFDKEAFFDGGMENEYMISFGPEDCERNDRFKMLGFDVRMVGGSLFHMQHWIGANSSAKNPHFAANHAELEKMRKMDADTMRRYVDTWPWRHQYTSRYFHRISEGSITSAMHVMAALKCVPDCSVIDVGCGVGEWHNSNPNYFGVDFRVKPEDLLIPGHHYTDANLEKQFPIADRTFDLCLCLEVAEHISIQRADALIEWLCSLSDNVLFSAAIPFQGGTGHVNEQWQEWWAYKFRKHEFYAAVSQPDIRNNPHIELWYRQNMVLYQRNGQGEVRNFVLPEYYEQITGSLHRRLQEGK